MSPTLVFQEEKEERDEKEDSLSPPPPIQFTPMDDEHVHILPSAIEQVTNNTRGRRKRPKQRAHIKDIKDNLSDITSLLDSFAQDSEAEQMSRIHSKVQRCMGISESDDL